MDEITLSSDLLIGLIIGVALPVLIWALRLFSMVKHLRDGHNEQAEHGFGSQETQDLLKQNLERQASNQREYIDSNKALRYAFKELSHFMRWMVKERTGKEPPPYVRD